MKLNGMYEMLRATGYSSDGEELVEILSCVLVYIYTKQLLKEGSVFNFQP